VAPVLPQRLAVASDIERISALMRTSVLAIFPRAMSVRSDLTRRGLGRAILEGCERADRAEGFTRLR
jgi:hypothetical protein